MQAGIPLKKITPDRSRVHTGLLLAGLLAGLGTIPAHASTVITAASSPVIPAATSSDVIAKPLVVNGTPATTTQVPWQVALFAQNNNGQAGYICSGTLIDAQWVVSAAHCFNQQAIDQQPITSYSVAVGTVDLGQLNNPATQIIRVSQKIIYPGYDVNLNLDNDIALLKLAQPVNLQACGMRCRTIAWLRPEQASQYTALGSLAQIAGWGETVVTDSTGHSETLYPSRLQVGQLSIVNCGTSRYLYNNQSWPVTNNMMCASGIDQQNPADTCVGDSGSGLVVNIAAGQPLLAGITSWGEDKPCGERRLPGVYTRVANYASWILSYVDPLAYQQQQEQQQQQAQQSASPSGSGGGGSVSVPLLLGLGSLILMRRKWLARKH